MLYEVVDQLALATALGVLAPIATLVGGRIVHKQRQKFALKQIEAEPLIHVGTRLHEVQTAEGASLIGECEVVSIVRGRIAVRTPDGKRAMSWSNEEFIARNRVVDVSEETQAQ